ncbi:cytochrome P450 [Actinopolymorpha alba]|uniref:cytochrome P450 n=1 Tax=Actinopolymorpha alba TaxID=533267 RepID=UPI000372F5B2|nr:cytochrome P450 [Actinopolymorpha alba]
MNATVSRATTHTGDPAWQISGYDTVKRLLADPRLGRSHAEPDQASRYSESMIFGRPVQTTPTERADHQQMRKLLTRSFSARRLAILRPRVQELVDRLLDDMERRTRPVDFHDAISFPLPAFVICELLGVPFEDRADFRRWSDDAADMTDGERSMAGLIALWEYMQALVDRKRREPAEDVITDLVTADKDGSPVYNNVEAAQLAAGLLFAGHETTVNAIDTGVVLLLTHPEQKEKLRHDPALVDSTVEEILRLGLPIPPTDTTCPGETPRAIGLPRYASADIDVDGATIRAGDLVVLDLRHANQDERHFPVPGTFDQSRAENPHMSFGHGPRFCLGAPLARIELQVLFGTLFRRFPTLRLAVPAEDLRHRSHLLTGGLAELPVAW